MNPNTVARAYRELEHEGMIEVATWIWCFYQRFGFVERKGDPTSAGSNPVRR